MVPTRGLVAGGRPSGLWLGSTPLHARAGKPDGRAGVAEAAASGGRWSERARREACSGPHRHRAVSRTPPRRRAAAIRNQLPALSQRSRVRPQHRAPPSSASFTVPMARGAPEVTASAANPAAGLAAENASARVLSGPRSHRFRWRRGWDSNPRRVLPRTAFRERHHKPLGHLSASECTNRRRAAEDVPPTGARRQARVPYPAPGSGAAPLPPPRQGAPHEPTRSRGGASTPW